MMIDISDIPEGVYTIRIDFNQGWMLKKIVKLK